MTFCFGYFHGGVGLLTLGFVKCVVTRVGVFVNLSVLVLGGFSWC